MKKNSGMMLTLEKARMLAVQEFGTDRGLSEGWRMQGGYIMQFGNLLIRIHPVTQRDIPVIKVEVCLKLHLRDAVSSLKYLTRKPLRKILMLKESIGKWIGRSP